MSNKGAHRQLELLFLSAFSWIIGSNSIGISCASRSFLVRLQVIAEVSGLEMDPQAFDDMVRRLQTNKGVIGVIVTNGEGRPIKIAMDKTLGIKYLDCIRALENLASALVRDLNPSDSLRLMRIQCKKNEMVLYKEKDFMLILIHGSDAIPASTYQPHLRHQSVYRGNTADNNNDDN